MKKFNNIQNLWDYCSICPFCKKSTLINIDLGPDECFKLLKCDKSNSLNIQCEFFSNRNYKIEAIIDCESNSSEFLFKDILPINKLINQASHYNLYFYVHFQCENCKYYTVTKDIDLIFYKKEINNIELELEEFSFEDYMITLFYGDNYMSIRKNSNFEKKFNLIDLNLLDYSSLSRKIHSILTFS